MGQQVNPGRLAGFLSVLILEHIISNLCSSCQSVAGSLLIVVCIYCEMSSIVSF